MRTLLLVVVLLGSTAAHAQPGQTEPIGYYVQQPVQLQLSEAQQALLARGEIPIGGYITGGILSYVLGFGIGHAVQGRWTEKGWIFTAGEVASMTAILYGVSQANRYDPEYSSDGHDHQNRRGRNYALAGIVGLVGFRVWGVIDAWVAPPIHNRKVRALKQQLGLTPPSYGFYLAPPQGSSGSGGVAGLALSF